MKIVIFILLIFYYAIMSVVFAGIVSIPDYDTAYTNNATLSSIDTTGNPTPFDAARFLSLLLFGIGLPSSTPTWVVFIFAIWQTCLLIVTILLLLSLTPLIPS